MSKKLKSPYCSELTRDEVICENTTTEIYFTIIFKDEMSIEDLTNILGIKPDLDSSWNKGEQRKTVKERLYEFSRWSMPSIFTENLIVDEQLISYLNL